jgi:hypothetical protein
MAEYEFDKEQLLRLIQRDCDLMLSFYLGDKLDLGVPEFHRELWDEFLHLLDEVNHPDMLVGILKKLLGVPREHAKTTLTKIACILFLRYSRLRFLAYVSNTGPSALNAVRDIFNWLTCEKEIQLYGQPIVEKKSESESLYILQIHVPGRPKPKRIIMKAFGVETQIRGMNLDSDRPDLMVFDDVESRETASTAAQQAKLDANVMGTALKAMAKMGVVIFIGNMISETTLLARLSKEPEWRSVVFGSIIRGVDGHLRPLWEERWTLDKLLEDYATFKRLGLGHVWEAEMMNLTSKEILGESLANCPRPPRPMPDEIEAGFLTLDPAFGVNAWNDESAITCHVRMRGADLPLVVETWHGRVKEEALFDEMLAMSYRWGITTWCIESVAAQRLLIPLFKAYLLQRGLSPDLFLMLPITGGKESKPSRIVAYRSSCAVGSYGIVEEEQDLVERLESYSPDTEKHDDVCDSAAFGLIVWALHGTTVTSQGRQDIVGALMGDHSGGATAAGQLEIAIY